MTRYFDSKVLGDLIFIHHLDLYNDQELAGLRNELEATMPERWRPLHRKNHRLFLEAITALEAERKAV